MNAHRQNFHLHYDYHKCHTFSESQICGICQKYSFCGVIILKL